MKEHIIINKDRTVVVPDSVRKIGIQYDHKVNTLTFDCPRYADDNQSIDMSRMAIYINFSRNDKTKGSIAATNVFVDPDDPEIMHFDVVITRSVTLVNGPIICLVCAKSTDAEGVEVNHWNSELFNKLSVGEGLEAEELTEEEIDYITSLLQEINTTRAEVADMDTRVEDLEFNQEKQGVVSEVDLEAMTWTEGSYITGSGTIGSSSGYGISELVTLPKMSTLILDATGYQSDVAMIAKSDHTPLATSVDGKTHYEYYTDEEIQVYISCKTTEAKSAKIVRNVAETLSDLERENSELKGDMVKSVNDIAPDKNGNIEIEISSGGITESIATALLNCFRNVAWINEHGKTLIDALDRAIQESVISEKEVVSIAVTYNGDSTVIVGRETNTLDITVIATFDDGTTKKVLGFTVSPETIVEGVNDITVTYKGKSATFEVIGEEIPVVLESITAVFNGTSAKEGTNASELDITVYGHYNDGSSNAVSGWSTSGTVIVGNNTFTISYEGKTCTISVEGIPSGNIELTPEEVKYNCYWNAVFNTFGDNNSYEVKIFNVSNLVGKTLKIGATNGLAAFSAFTDQSKISLSDYYWKQSGFTNKIVPDGAYYLLVSNDKTSSECTVEVIE